MDFDSTNQKVKFAIQTESKDSQIANHLQLLNNRTSSDYATTAGMGSQS